MLIVRGQAKETLVRLLNENNVLPEALTVDGVVFGPARAISARPNGAEITLVPVIDSRYVGAVKVNYPRLNLTQAFGDVKPIITALGGSSLHSMLGTITEALGIDMLPEDVVDVKIDWLSTGGQVNIPIKAVPGSLGYVGSFLIQFNRLRPELDEFITNRDLPVFVHPVDPTLGKRSLSMETFGLDFTENLAGLGIRNGRWLNSTYVADLMLSLGYPSWPGVTNQKLLYSGSTANYAKANKNFDWVIVQPGIDQPLYKGDAYFHYNLS